MFFERYTGKCVLDCQKGYVPLKTATVPDKVSCVYGIYVVLKIFSFKFPPSPQALKEFENFTVKVMNKQAL